MSLLVLEAEQERRQRQRQKAEEALDFLAWMRKHRAYLEPYRKLDFSNHQYLIDIYQCTAQRMILYKAAQVGVSEYLISCGLFGCARMLATVLYMFPSSESVGDFSTQRLGPAIECSPYLTKLVVSGRGRGADRVKLKRIGNRFLYFRGSKVNKAGQAPQLKSIPADMLIVDEVDECDPRAIPIAQKRLGHSELAIERYGSTPSYNGVGIHALYEQSDKRQWFIPCPSCGKRQSVTIKNIVLEEDNLGRPVRWNGQGDTAYPACSECGARLDLSAPGEWVAEHPGIATAGFHVTKFTAPWCDFDGIIEALQDINETKRRETINQDLGLPYDAQGLSITEALLRNLQREYGHGLYGGQGKRYMGVDVGAVLHIVIREEQDTETGERRQLYAGTVADFDDLHGLIKVYQPACIVCDALPETKSARKAQATYRKGLFWLCYYDNLRDGSKRDDPLLWNRHERIVTADRTRTMDETVARYVGKQNTVPAYDVTDYTDQVCAPTRIIDVREDGTRIAKYISATADHYFHAENYCTIASERKPSSAIG